MPYDPMASIDGSKPIQFDAKGPYWTTYGGGKNYISPVEAEGLTKNATGSIGPDVKARLASYRSANPTPTSSFLHPSQGTWNASEGQFDPENFFNTPLGAIVLGGSVPAAGALTAAFGGAAPAAAGASGSASATAGAVPAAGGAGSLSGGSLGIASGIAPEIGGAVAGAGGGMSSWLGPLLKGTVPLGVSLLNRPQNAGDNGLNGTGLPPELLEQLKQLIAMSMQRQQETQPVHQAAMLLAQRLATANQTSPDLRGAVSSFQAPAASAPMHPNVSAALARLMGR